MATQIQIKRGSTTPAGLTVGESAMNTSTNQIYLGGTGGTVLVGGEVTGGVDMGAGSAVSANRIPTQSGVYNYVRNSTVTSFNGATGAVGGVTTSAANTFTALQSFSAGISAAGGVTLAGTLQGTTAAFTRLVSSTVGFSGAGTDLTGNASGLTAGTATRVITTATNSASTFYPTFVGGAGNTALFIDPTLGPLSYVPSTATLKLTNLDIAAGALTIGAFQLTASTYFYFVASNGINFQDPTLISMGDYGAVAGKTLFEVYPTVGTRYACLYNSDWANNATLMVNRLSPVGTHAFEVNRSDGKAAKLIYGDTGGAASNYVDLDVSSAGNLTITPSGSLVTITGRLDVSAGISAAGGVTLAGTLQGTTAAFTGLVSSTVGFSGSGTNLKNIVTTFNGLSGAVTGASLGANTFTALNTFNAGISASALTVSGGVTFSSAIVLPINTAPALTIGTHATKNLILSCVDNAGLIEVGGPANASLGIRQASGGPVQLGSGSGTYFAIFENDNYINVQSPTIIIGDGDGVGNSTFLDINDAATTITATCGSFGVSGRLDMNGGYSEAGATATQATNTITFNALSGNTQKFVPSAVVNTVNFTNIATTSTQCTSATLIFLHGATPYGLTTGTFSVQLAGVTKTVKWSGGSAPTLTNTANKTDILNFLTYDGGTTWLGFVGGLNF